MAEPPQQMDEILASIRRIIAEEPARPPAGDAAEVGEGDAGDAAGEVLELGDPPPAPPPASGLLSSDAAAASRTALAALSGLHIDPNAPDHTMDGLVRELVRPMLKEWLDANLPEIVERLVAREVARIGGR